MESGHGDGARVATVDLAGPLGSVTEGRMFARVVVLCLLAGCGPTPLGDGAGADSDRKSTRLNSSH